MLKKLLIFAGVTATAFTGYLYAQALNSASATPAATNTNAPMTLKPCPDKPNCVSTQATQPDKQRDPIPFTGSAAEAITRLKQITADMPRTTLVKEDGNYLHFTHKTWPIPFIDDVEFIVDPAKKVIDYRSASRVGHSDLGVNSKRMAKLVAAFAAK